METTKKGPTIWQGFICKKHAQSYQFKRTNKQSTCIHLSTEAKTKWPIFRRRHFKCVFSNKNCCIFHWAGRVGSGELMRFGNLWTCFPKYNYSTVIDYDTLCHRTYMGLCTRSVFWSNLVLVDYICMLLYRHCGDDISYATLKDMCMSCQ